MYLALAIVGSLLGLLITGVAVYTIWVVHQLWKQQMETAGDRSPQPAEENEADPAPAVQRVTPAAVAGQYLSRWRVLDYGVVGLFIIGMMLLTADLLAVMRDKASFPDYHLAYLLCGAVFTFLGMLFLFVRLAVVLSLRTDRSFSPDHQHQPHHANQAE